MKMSSRRFLPPTTALASFVAAARHNSFSLAGEEMGLTQSAISRQIALLEDWLQLSLFDRHGRRVVLSAEGEAYLAAISPAMERIRSATADALSRRSERELNIATLPSFGMRWLAPRLPSFSALHPDVVVNFAARSFPFSFADEAFDAAIHFGKPDWQDASHDLLFFEEAIPVCSPERLARQPINCADDVLDWPLLVLATRRDAWTQWFKEAGVDRPTPSPSGSFEHFMMLAQTAAAGAGIALVPRFLIETELANGTLVCPLPVTLRGEGAYYLVLPAKFSGSSSMDQFRLWLLKEVASLDANSD